MKRSLLELGKSLLIILLIASLLLLTVAALPRDMLRGTPWLSGILQPLAPLLGLPQADLAYVADARSIPSAAQPLSISVRNAAGRYTAQWSFAALDSTYDSLGGLLGQALDTAGDCTAASEEQLTQALSAVSVCFDYGAPLPVSLIASWLDAAPSGDLLDSRRFLLALEEEQVVLYLDSHRAVTRIPAGEFTALLEAFSPDGSAYTFETDSHLAPLTLIPAAAPTVYAAEAASPCDNRYIESLATALGFNPYDDSRYTDSANVTHFSESSCSLQISASGEILLLSSEDRFRADSSSPDALAEYARSLTELAAGSLSGNARLYLSGVTVGENETVCTFDYVLGGIPVSCGGQPAASVTFSGSTLTKLTMYAIRFSAGTEPLQLLPPAQTAAILPAGSDLILQYQYTGSGILSAGWAG